MIPVRTAASNFVYRGPTPDIGDAWVERAPGIVFLDWQPSDEERAAIAGGALLRLGIHGMEPIPPVSLNVSNRCLLSEAGSALRDRAGRVLEHDHKVPGPERIPPGHWTVSSDVWQDLNAQGSLDPSDGVPLLLGRPLMEVPGAPDGTLEYVPVKGDA